MELERISTDALEQQLITDERSIAQLRARQMAVLELLDVRQVATGDGCRSLSEWFAGRIDLAPETAKTLVRTMRRLHDRPDLQAELAEGRVCFDQVEAVSRISGDVGLMEWADVAGVRREAAKRARISAEDETRAAGDRYLAMQPTSTSRVGGCGVNWTVIPGRWWTRCCPKPPTVFLICPTEPEAIKGGCGPPPWSSAWSLTIPLQGR